MKAKFVLDVLNESFTYIPFDRNPQDLKEEYPQLFGTLSFATIANALHNLTPELFVQEKIDLNRFYNFLRRFKGYQKSFKEMKDILLKAAPLLGITNKLKLRRDELSELKFQEKLISGDYDLDFYANLEIPKEEAEENDYVIRSMYGETEPAYYRFDKQPTSRDINMLKAAYAYEYGDPEKTLWRNYLDARPATVGHIQRHGKSMEYTKQYGDYVGVSYESLNEGYIKHYMMELAQFVVDNFYDLPEGRGIDEMVDAYFPSHIYDFYLDNKESIMSLVREIEKEDF